MKLTKNITSSVGGYLPNTLTEMWEPSRDFAFLKLPVTGARCVVAISGYVFQLLEKHMDSSDYSMVRTMPHVMVISSEGYFYSYNIDLENGGECSLMKQYRLVCPSLPYASFLITIRSLLDSAEESAGLIE